MAAATQALLCNSCFCHSTLKRYKSQLSISHYYFQLGKNKEWHTTKPLICYWNQENGLKLKKSLSVCHAVVSSEKGNGDNIRKILWVTEGVYILWLFLLPYAPGDPVWAISKETVNSLNCFFILPFICVVV